jgi:hypothetical protein
MSCIKSGTTLISASPYYHTGPGYGCPVNRAIVDYHNIPGVAYGKYTGNNVKGGGARDQFGAVVSAQFRSSEDDSGYTDAATVYQDVLAAQPDHSVTIICTGYLSNIANLLVANGAIVTAKVKELIFVAGVLPGPAGDLWNMLNDVPDTNYVIANWPSSVPFTWCGIELGNSGLWGRPAPGYDPTVNPIGLSFDNAYPGHLNASSAQPAGYRWFWSLPALLHAAWPGVYTQFLGTNGKVTLSGSGFPSTVSTTWNAGTPANHNYLGLRVSTTALNALADQLLNAPIPSGFPSANYAVGTTVKGNATVKVK